MTQLAGGDSDPLYQTALVVEQDEGLAVEMAEWEQQTLGDGIGDGSDKARI
jgi:hypothetical protein